MKFWDLRCEFDPFVKNSVYCGGCVCLFMESGVYVCVCVCQWEQWSVDEAHIKAVRVSV